MKVGEIASALESLGFTKDSIQDKPVLFSQLVFLATHFYSQGFTEAVSYFTDDDIGN